MTTPPASNAINAALVTMQIGMIGALTDNAAEAMIAGDVAATLKLKIPLNFHIISSRAVAATQDYRTTLERLGGSDVTEVGEDGVARRVFKPWLKDAIESDRKELGQIIQDGVKKGTPLKELEKQIGAVFDNREINAKLAAFQETKALYNKGSFDRYNEMNVQQGIWHHMDPQPNPREEHQDLDGQVFDLDDPIWFELDLPYCHCRCEPVLSVGGGE
jgi:SPP1 gp7 family putative phage head morphogenesis protein